MQQVEVNKIIPVNPAVKRSWFFFLIGYFSAGYFVLNHFNLYRSSYLDVSFAFERGMPFIPAAIFGYSLVFLSLLVLYFLLHDALLFRRTVVTFLVTMTVHFLFFWLFPVRMTFRPEVNAGEGFTAMAAYLYFLIDQPTNCFPSLHVAFPTLGMCLLWRSRRHWRWFFMVMTMATAVSVVLVKQHYIADTIAGFLVAVLCSTGVRMTERYWSRSC